MRTADMAAPSALELELACTDFNLVSRDAEHLRERRNTRIVQAAASGLTQQQLSEITGLSRGRINQIVKAAR